MEPPRFPTVPDDEQVAKLERLLRFHPSPVEKPAHLSPQQLRSWHEDGFIRPLPLLDAREVAELRSYFDRLLERTLARGGDGYSISSAHLEHGRVWDLLRHPKLIAWVRDLLGQDVVGWGSHFFLKMPRDGKRVPWHQDASYWPLSPSKTVTVWLALDDADHDNSCLRFLPGTHLRGHLPYGSAGDEAALLDQEVSVEDEGRAVDNVLRAGECSLHSDLLLHGSEANRSARRRCGLTLRYAAASVRAALGWNAKGVLVSGSDPAGHWSNPGRPNQN